MPTHRGLRAMAVVLTALLVLAASPARAADELDWDAIGEEAVELIIEAVRGKRKKTSRESADLMYHLLALWADAGIHPDEVWQALAEREGVSGLAEKAARKE